MKKSLVTVVIPVHLEQPSELEILSLDQILGILNRYPIALMAPTGLDTTWYEDYCRGKAAVHVERFEWQGHEAYCELMVDPAFYQRFLNYEYLLNCHLDAFVFRDELEKWCQLGYDYIGAVIYTHQYQRKNTLLRRLRNMAAPKYFGNGGFALKKVASFYRITSKFKFYITFNRWVRRLRDQGFVDDIFIAQNFPKLSPSFSIPPQAIAQAFGAEFVDWDEAALPFTNKQVNTLPFGVHGWIQFQQDYWKPCIREYGYNI